MELQAKVILINVSTGKYLGEKSGSCVILFQNFPVSLTEGGISGGKH